MPWPKPEITLINPPLKPKRLVWIAVFAVLLIITGTLLILMWSDNRYFSAVSFWVMLILVPALIGSIALSLRFYQYGIAQEHFEIWQQEQALIEDNWQEWAMRSVRVMGSYWITPNELTAASIIFDLKNLPVQIEKVLAFENDEQDDEPYFEDLFYSMAQSINQLPNCQKMTITVYSSPESYAYLDDTIAVVSRRCQIKPRYTFKQQISQHVALNDIIQLIDNPSDEPHLLIMNNLRSHGSAFLGAILIVDEQLLDPDLAQMVESHLLRPMETDDITDGIHQMVEMQPALSGVTQLWCANLDKAHEIEIAKQLAEHNISPKAIHFLDSIAGQQTDLAHWSLLALGNQLVKQTNESLLLASKSNGQFLFSVLTKKV